MAGVISAGVSLLHVSVLDYERYSPFSVLIVYKVFVWFQPHRKQNRVILEFVNNLSYWILTDKYFAFLDTSV